MKILLTLMLLFIVSCSEEAKATNNRVGIQVNAAEFGHKPLPNLSSSDTRTNAGKDYTSWKDLQKACKNPRSVNNQQPPARIAIMCHTKKCQWEWVQDGEIDGINVCMYGARTTTSKRNVSVDAEYWGYKDEPTKVPCLTLQFVCYEIGTPSPVTCEEVAVLSGMKEFCEDKMANFDMIELGEKKVMETKHICPNINPKPPTRTRTPCVGQKCN